MKGMKRKPAVGFIFVTIFLDVLGIGLIIPILPKLVEYLQGGNIAAASHTVGFLTSLYALMQFLCAPVLGSLSDRFGRRPVILGSLFGSGVDYILLAFAPNLAWFFAGRIIAGVTGANITAATAYIADISPPEKRAANFGLIGAAFGLGFITGPALGGLLGAFSLRLPFLVAAGLTILNWLYGYFVLPESHAVANRRAFSWKRANPIGSFHGLAAYPLVFRLAVALFLMSLAQTSLQSTWALYTDYRYHWTPKEIGMSLAVVGLVAAIVQGGLARVIVPRLGEKHSVLAGFSLSALAFAFYGWAPRGWMLYPALIVGCTAGIAQPAGQALISWTIGPSEQGSVQGAITSLGSLAGIIGPLVATNLFGWFIGPKAPAHIPGIAFYLASAIVLCALTVVARAFATIPVPARHAAVEIATAK
jgi:DHA1 family tetracycline resistance protein-like MFS transporter